MTFLMGSQINSMNCSRFDNRGGTLIYYLDCNYPKLNKALKKGKNTFLLYICAKVTPEKQCDLQISTSL